MIIICNDDDLVQDGAEKELLKEIELISGVQVTEISSACSLVFAKTKNLKKLHSPEIEIFLHNLSSHVETTSYINGR